MISEREKACFIQGVMLATPVVDTDTSARIVQLAMHLRRALITDNNDLRGTLCDIAHDLYMALIDGGFDGEAATRPVQ